MSKSLLEAWRLRDLESFRAALREDGATPDYLYPEEGYRSLLESIASTVSPESRDFAKALIVGRATVDLINPTTGKAALHHAAEAFNHPVLEVLLTANADVNIQDLTGSTTLHLLARKVPSTLDKAHEQCLDLILSWPDLYLNKINKKGLSPLMAAYEKGAWRVMMKLLKAGAYVEDINYKADGKRSLKDEIRERCPEILNELPAELGPISANIGTSFEELISLLRSSSEDRFRYAFNMYIADIRRRDSFATIIECRQLLQCAVERGLKKPTKTLLAFIKNNDDSDDKPVAVNKAILTACQKGNPKIIQLIIEDFPGCLSKGQLTEKTALHVLAETEDFTENHTECWNLVKNSIDINALDGRGRTALHVAARIENSTAVEMLLCGGANMFLQDDTGTPAFSGIPIEVLEKFFDSKIIKQGDTEEYHFDHQFLNPNRGFSKIEEEISLITGKFSNSLPELKPLQLLAHSDFSPFLRHPIFKAFVAQKWKLARPFYYAKLICSLIFLTVLLIFLDETCSAVDEQWTVLSVFLKSVLIFFLIFIYIHAILYLFALPLSILMKPQRYVYFFLILSTTGTVAWGHLCNVSSPSRIMSTATILLSAVHLVFILGGHPQLALPFYLAQSLLIKCLQVIAIHTIPLFAFALSFSLLSRGCDGTNCTTTFFGGFTFEVTFVDSGRGLYVERNSQILFVLFLIIVITALVHLIGVAVIECKRVLENPDVFSLKPQIEFIADLEESLIEAPQTRLKEFARYIPFSHTIPRYLQKLAQRILFFSEKDARLRLLTDQGNKLRTFQSERKKSPWWDKPVHLSSATVREIAQIVRARLPELKTPPEAKIELMLSNLMEKTNQIADRMKLSTVAIEKLENKSKEMEDLLIQSLRISNLRDEGM